MIARRRFLAACGACAVSLSLPRPARSAEPAPDWNEIKRVIAAQRAALVAGDADRAFAFASPGIRAQFGAAANFLAMVRSGYAALLAARHVEFLEGAVIEGNVIQPLRLIMPDDEVLVALYSMQQQPDRSWRILGCAIAPSTVRAT
jgi:hypothetical protein